MYTSSPLFDEKAADEAVMHSLHSEISRLREELQMSQVIKSVDGRFYVGEFEEVTPEQVTEMIARKQHQLAELEAIAPANDNGGQDGQAPTDGSGQPGTDSPAAPSGDGSAPAAPAADPNAPAPSAPADQSAPAPAAPAAPVDDQQVPRPEMPQPAAPAQPQAPALQ